jgi:hypothetical protein
MPQGAQHCNVVGRLQRPQVCPHALPGRGEKGAAVRTQSRGGCYARRAAVTLPRSRADAGPAAEPTAGAAHGALTPLPAPAARLSGGVAQIRAAAGSSMLERLVSLGTPGPASSWRANPLAHCLSPHPTPPPHPPHPTHAPRGLPEQRGAASARQGGVPTKAAAGRGGAAAAAWGGRRPAGRAARASRGSLRRATLRRARPPRLRTSLVLC